MSSAKVKSYGFIPFLNGLCEHAGNFFGLAEVLSAVRKDCATWSSSVCLSVPRVWWLFFIQTSYTTEQLTVFHFVAVALCVFQQDGRHA